MRDTEVSSGHFNISQENRGEEMSNFYRTADSAIEELTRLRPDITLAAVKRNRTRIRHHLETDYSDGRGLRLLGHGGNKTKNFIEFYDNEEKNRIDVEFLVAVDIDGQWEVFSSDEALGYTVFIIAKDTLEKRKAEEKERHLQEKKAEHEPV